MLQAGDARTIHDDPELLDEAQRALPALLAEANYPSGRDGVKKVVGQRFALFPQPPRSDGEWAAWWADYFDVLADIPVAALEAGMAAWVKHPDSEFMPKPGKLRELALSTPNRAAGPHETARRAVNLAALPMGGVEPAPERQPTTESERQAVKRMLASYLETTARERTIPAFPPSHGRTDERGLTPQMRALRERQLAAAEQDNGWG